MKETMKKVEIFHETFKQKNGTGPALLNHDEFELRHKLMAEENDEYLEACDQDDIVGIADALGDQLYILCGTILKHGLQHKIEEVFNEIHLSNMSKLDANGEPILREDGKIMKSNRYFKPDIAKIVYK
jgi:predicted HAD superfamily Cof-like phosphohydrolase